MILLYIYFKQGGRPYFTLGPTLCFILSPGHVLRNNKVPNLKERADRESVLYIYSNQNDQDRTEVSNTSY